VPRYGAGYGCKDFVVLAHYALAECIVAARSVAELFKRPALCFAFESLQFDLRRAPYWVMKVFRLLPARFLLVESADFIDFTDRTDASDLIDLTH